MSEENKNNTKNNNPKTKINQRPYVGIKRPLTPYFLFCKDKRQEFKQQNFEQKLTALELGKMWRALSPTKKKEYEERYQKEKVEYEKLQSLLKAKKETDADESDSEGTPKVNRKKKVKPNKKSQRRSNKKACNCGNCDECRKNTERKKMNQEPDTDDEE